MIVGVETIKDKAKKLLVRREISAPFPPRSCHYGSNSFLLFTASASSTITSAAFSLPTSALTPTIPFWRLRPYYYGDPLPSYLPKLKDLSCVILHTMCEKASYITLEGEGNNRTKTRPASMKCLSDLVHMKEG